uniref:N-acetyltransferase domain-containing protein n=1 Tax=viral metagenome TaxID=1070528 RepID=A0A6C0ELA5_9ZZZZ
MDIKDFLPKYPNVNKSSYGVLNPYDDNFYQAIFRKKEFYDNRLDRVEVFPRERGMLTKHQKTIAHYLSSNTPYNKLMLVHSMGTGKTCSAIGAIEQIKSEDSTFDGALVFAGGEGLLDNFVKELVEKCTPGQYKPENYEKLTDLQKIRRISKTTKFYHLDTFRKFAQKIIAHASDDDIRRDYSNKIIVIDEVHNLRPQGEDDDVKTYWHFHRFLHLIENSKIMLLSGTPMQDSPEEIASVANLLLPMDQQLPMGKEFLEEYMEEKNQVYILKKDKAKDLKEKLKGYVSFLREAYSNVTKEYIGKEGVGSLKHFIVDPGQMSKFQSKAYARAVEKDQHGKKSGVWSHAREAILFVYPDGSWGREGFEKYIKRTERKAFVAKGKKKAAGAYVLSDGLRKALKGESDEETLANIRRYSVKYAQIIEKILNTKGNCFIYGWYIKGSGAILFSLLLGLFGFSKANGKENTPGLRYGILTTKTAAPAEIRRITDRFNRPDNMNGEYIKVIIGSKTVSEGYSFRNVLFEAILTPHWNYSVTAQAIARGIRLGSHNDLIKAGENPTVQIMQPVSFARKEYTNFSIDLQMYETSEDKDISIRSILRLLMEVSFDCALNYFRNYIDAKKGSRECDYTSCNYKCEGVDIETIKAGLDDSEIDYSTYQLFYANPKIPLIRRKIEHLFRNNHQIDLDSIIENLKDEFSEDEIRNALHTIQEETGSKEFDYRDFLEIYSRSPVKKIMNGVEQLFREHFRLNLNTILEQFPQYTQFEVLTALRTLINDSTVILNKYGISSYLREDNNVYFLVNSLTINATFYSEYYTRYPHVSTNQNFTDIMNSIYVSALPKLAGRICRTDNEKEFGKLMKSLPIEIQELFIEASLVARDKKIKKTRELRRRIIEFFKNYIKKIDNVWISTLLQDSAEVLRCRDVGADFDKWSDCDEKYRELVQEQEISKKRKLREDNPYGIIGTYNPTTKDFCIVDLNREKAGQSKREKGVVDKRLSHTGKVCSGGGWKLPELMEIAIKRLQIDPPNSFKKTDSRQSMIAYIQKDPRLMKIFTKEELETADDLMLRRALYWGLPPKDNGRRKILFLCEDIKKWLDERGLLQVDDQCGVQGKKKITAVSGGGSQDPTKNYRLERVIPTQQEEKFKSYGKDIAKLMGECFGAKKYQPEINNNTWILVFSRKKLVGFITVDDDNILWNVCVAKNYRRQGIARAAMKMATNDVCSVRGKRPTLLVDNRNKDATKLIRMYKSFGFDIQRADERYTYMEHPCT